MLLVPVILLHLLIMIHALKHNLTETVKISQIRHLVVEQMAHQGSGFGRIVYLSTYQWCVSKEDAMQANHGPAFDAILHH